MSTSQRPVLAALDGSPDSVTAVETAAVEASRRRLPLRLVTCAAPSRGFPPSCWRPATDPLDGLERVLTRIARRSPGLEVIAESHPGDLTDLLVDESRRCSLVVVGPGHTGGYDRLSNNWLTHRVLTHAHCPVLVARSGFVGDERPVVVGVDGSEHGGAAVRLGFEEAALRQVPLRAVHAFTTGPDPADDRRAAAERLLRDATARWTEAYPDVKLEFEPTPAPDPAYALLWAAVSADLVVIGSRGGMATDRLLGPAGRALVERAPCAVLIAHAPVPTDTG
jgi:nucleotide-binding universal stress UspA family protein